MLDGQALLLVAWDEEMVWEAASQRAVGLAGISVLVVVVASVVARRNLWDLTSLCRDWLWW